jgi:acetyl esterase
LILFNPWLGVAAPADKAFLPDDYHVMAPLEHMRNDLPPTLILQGRADTTTPYSGAVQYCEEARSKGGKCEVVGYDGAEHGFFNAPDFDSPNNADNPEKATQTDFYRQTLFKADQFLSSLEYFSIKGN